jgi:chromosome segregation ATPase
MSEETKEHEIEKLVDDIIKSPDFEALKRKATYLIKSSQTSEISQLKRKLEIVESVLKQAQEDFDKQITELKEAFDTAHNTNLYLRGEVNRLNNIIADRDWTIEQLKKEIVCQGYEHNAEITELKDENERLKAEPQAQSVEADGYVAIYSKQHIEEPANPDIGYCGTLNTGWQHSFSTSRGGAQNYIFNKYFGVCFEEDSKKDCAALRSLYADGWKIRPVKLQFLDEGKCKKE